MSIDVNKENVKQAIININKEYPTVFDNLKAANSKFDGMKDYWYGERYQKIVEIWNETIPMINGQLQVLADVAKTMSSMLKNFTMADTDTMNVVHVTPKKLTPINKKTDTNIKIDQVKLAETNKAVLKNISLAKASIEKIINIGKRADWKSPAVDTLNSTLESIHKNLTGKIDKISKAVNENLTTTVEEFNEADKASTLN